MNDFKMEYYKNLKRDFDEKIEKSAIFAYIRDEYEKDAGTPKADDDKRNYIKLRRLQLRYDCGEIDIPEFIEGYIRIKLGMPKINMEKNKTGAVYGNRRTMARVKNRQAISIGFDRLAESLVGGKKNTKGKMEGLLKAACEDRELFAVKVRECFRDSDVVPVSLEGDEIDLPCEICRRPGIVQMITYEMLHSIIMFDISAKFYDMGFRQIKYSEDAGYIDSSSEIGELVPRKKDKSLDLVEKLFQTKRLNNPFARSACADPQMDEDKLEYESVKLLDILNTERRTDICIPIKVDSATGCGVYILGREYYMDRSLKVMESRDQYCRFGIVELDPGLAPDTIFDIRTIDDSDPDEYQSVVDIWRTQVVSDAYDELKERNGVLPDGCSNYFAGWFSDVNDDWFESRITDGERIACTEQLDRDKQQFMKRYH